MRAQRNDAAAPAPAAETVPFALDYRRLSHRGFITPEIRGSRLSEEVRLVKRRLMRRLGLDAGGSAVDAERVIMVTSARPGEGKSFVALNLALSFAIDERLPVLLVDADYARSTNSDLLHFPRSPGLIEALLDDSLSLGAVTRCAERLPVGIVPPGSIVASATDLYAGVRMTALLREACRTVERGVVIIDAPPLLSTTEAMVLAPQAKEVLLVIEAERTPESTIRSALELLEPCENVSLVLNMAPPGATDRFGTYHVRSTRANAPASAAGSEVGG